MSVINTLAELEKIYSTPPVLAAKAKEINFVSPHYRKLIEASPFAILATSGPEGLDCSPRGDKAGFVRIKDERTLVMPDRRGNNRIDSLRNILRDPRVALLFLIPGSGTTFRVNGKAVISADPELLASFTIEGKPPHTAIVITVEAAYFQCARAIVRSGLWDATRHVDASKVPTPGSILEALSRSEIDGRAYDTEWPDRASKTLW